MEATSTENAGKKPDFSTIRKAPFGSEIACNVRIRIYSTSTLKVVLLPNRYQKIKKIGIFQL
jgi:hypothetical protein